MQSAGYLKLKPLVFLAINLIFAFLPLTDCFSITGPDTQDSEQVSSERNSSNILNALQRMSIVASPPSGTISKRQARIEKKLYKKFTKKTNGPERPKKPKQFEPTAIVSFSTGIGGFLLMLAPILTFFLPGILFLAGLASCIVAIVFGLIALKKFNNGFNDGRGKGFAIAGLITGSVLVAAVATLIVIFITTF